MHTRNTITQSKASRLDRAIFTLQMLYQEQSIPIIEYLRENDGATFLDLTLHTGLGSLELERQLEKLCLTRVVVRRENIFGCHYQLDPVRIQRISSIARQLASFRKGR